MQTYGEELYLRAFGGFSGARDGITSIASPILQTSGAELEFNRIKVQEYKINTIQAQQYARRYLQPALAGYAEGKRNRHKYITNLFNSQVNAIAGYLANPGLQTIDYKDGNPSEAVRSALDSFLMQSRSFLMNSLIYGRVIALVLPSGQVMQILPSQMLDVYNSKMELLQFYFLSDKTMIQFTKQGTVEEMPMETEAGITEAGAQGVPPELMEFINSSQVYKGIPAVPFIHGKDMPVPGQSYVNKLLSLIEAIEHILTQGLTNHYLHGKRFFASENGIEESLLEKFKQDNVHFLEGVAKGEIHEIGNGAVDAAMEQLIQIIYRMVARETGVLDWNDIESAGQVSTETMEIKVHMMDLALADMCNNWQMATRDTLKIISEVLGYTGDCEVTFKKNIPGADKKKMEELRMAGASLRTRLAQQGLDPDQELANLAEERAQLNPPFELGGV